MQRQFSILISSVLLISVCFGQVGDVVQTIEAKGQKITGVTFDGKYIWAADTISNRIYSVEPKSGKVINSFESPGFWPEGLAWDGEALWHVDSGQRKMYRIDPKTGEVLKVINSCCGDPRGLAWDGEHLWVADHKLDTLIRVSTADGSAVSSFASPGGEPTGVAFDGKYLWVADRSDDRIYLVETEKGMCLSSMRSYGPYAYGLGWADGKLVNGDFENGQVYVQKVFDDDVMSRWDKKELGLHFVKHFVKYGPGTVKNLHIYLPLPRSRDSQVLRGEVEFDTEPDEIVEDQWGQRIAHYHFEELKGYQDIKVGWSVKADVYASEYFIHPEKVGSLDDIPKEIKKKYLADGEKYQINDEYIQKMAKEIAGDEENPFLIARKIVEHLGEKLSYNLKPIGYWNPAPFVLKRGTGSCSEYTYSTIALCRALGIPARYVGAVTHRGDDGSIDSVFHRWVEIYIPNYGWVPFDSNKADQERPGQKVLGIGNVAGRYLITTENGGGDEYLWFGYNHNNKYVTEGRCEVYEEAYGIWSPAGEKKTTHKPVSIMDSKCQL